jgi:hypothetical protein
MKSQTLRLVVLFGVLSRIFAYVTFPAAEAILRRLPGLDRLSNINGMQFSQPLLKPDELIEELRKATKSLPQPSFPPFEGSDKWAYNAQFSLDSVKESLESPAGVDISVFANVVKKLIVLHDSIPFAGLYDVGLIAVAGAVALTLYAGQLSAENSEISTARMTPQKLDSDDMGPYGSTYRYNPAFAADYFSRRPLLVFKRALEIAILSASFGVGLLVDLINDKLTDREQEEKRADELTDILTRLGPTFIKVGQSLSIRTDLLRPAYIKGLTKLQDKVPPFPTVVARKIIEEELGRPIEEVFQAGIEPSASVVAAASLGQVYKAKLRSDGSEVRETILY